MVTPAVQDDVGAALVLHHLGAHLVVGLAEAVERERVIWKWYCWLFWWSAEIANIHGRTFRVGLGGDAAGEEEECDGDRGEHRRANNAGALH